MEKYWILLFCYLLLPVFIMCIATDTINPSQFINDGETMVSAGGTFELGFFSPGKSTKRYLGIWYKKIPSRAVVWVANRETPLIYTSGVLMFTNLGDLVVVDHHRTVLWSTNASISVMNPVAQLLDSGNLVLRDGEDDNADNFLWQSFDHPGNTFLPGMKLKINLITGIDRHLTSWKSQNDPSQGCFTLGVDPRGYPQLVTRNGSDNQWASGPWNGLRFSGTPYLIQNPVFNARFIINQKEIYYTFDLVDNSVLLRAVLNQNGILEGSVWIDRTQAWNLYRITQTDNCDSYALCGAYGYCNFGKLACACLKGFVPKHPKEWNMMDWSNGCVRLTPLNCQKGDKFIKLSGLKLPDTRYSWFNDSMNLDECEIMCLRNCSCMAYSNLDISTGGSGCLLWFGDLIDIMELTENGQEIYVRMASSEVGPVGSIGKKGVKIRIVKIIISFAVLTGMLLIGLTLYIIWKWRMPSRQGKMEHNQESQQEDIELPLFDLATVANATNNFSFNNKLGVGGFGTVYKGVLEGGQEIAVKRLSRDSKQGLNEFKNEVLCIAKLQHRNLVKLLGCCIQEEKMLIYEYMPNKSLDSFIFDQTKRSLLNWDVRFNIISGIARGILYLHQDSRLRIIHRDLKASNILLDYEMNPKISDFGMATIFGGNQTQAKTTKLVGTYGYMSPEYQSDGLYSVKSDVFSFGVLVLEIVSGKRNSVFQDHQLNLLEYAWTLYDEGRTMELVDASMGELCNLSQVLRSIHVGLLCIQDNPEDRPSMLDVVVMLSSESALPQPTQPSFFTGRSSIEDGDFSSNKQHEIRSSNGMSVTILVGR